VAVVRVVQEPEGWRFDSHSKIGETDSWRGVSPPPRHGRGALEYGTVPPSMLPGRCDWLPTAPVYVSMCVFNRLDGLKAEDNTSDLNVVYLLN